MWVTFLDPRSRNMKHLSGGEYTSAKQKLVEEIEDLTWNTKNTTLDIINLIWSGSNDREEDPFFKEHDFDSPIKVVDPTENSGSTGESGFEMHANAVKREVENYLVPQMILSPKTDPL